MLSEVYPLKFLKYTLFRYFEEDRLLKEDDSLLRKEVIFLLKRVFCFSKNLFDQEDLLVTHENNF